MSDDLVGKVFGDRFRLVRRLGAGGMGAVYVAEDTRDGDRRVAIKLIRDNLLDNAEVAARFDREVNALRQVPHENIVAFLEAGTDGNVRWLAMELLEGRTLKERIQSRGSMPWPETLPIVRGIVRALEAAHAQGLIHRDLKPENVFLVDPRKPGDLPGVKLLDFGVAKHTTLPEGMTMTGTGILVGTPGFVAPEVVLRGTSDDPRSDFYGLGATWFEMLTGSKPFNAATPFALAMRHVNERPPRASDLRPFAPVPDVVETLLAALLAKTPEARPPSAAALLEELDRLIRALESGDLNGSAQRTVTDARTPMPSTMIASLTPATTTHATAPATPGPLASAPASTPEVMRVPRKRTVAAMSAMLAFACVLSALFIVAPLSTTSQTPAVVATPENALESATPFAVMAKSTAEVDAGPDAGTPNEADDEDVDAGPSSPADAGPPAHGPMKKGSPTGKHSPADKPRIMAYPD